MNAPDLPHAEHTLAELLKEQGYLTAHGASGISGTPVIFRKLRDSTSTSAAITGVRADLFLPVPRTIRQRVPVRASHGMGPRGRILTDRLTEEAIRIIERAGDRPFFINLCHYAVHTPMEAPADDVAAFEARRKLSFHHQNAKYAAMVQNIDDSLGRLLAKLDELKLADRTAVILTSDNGGFIGALNGAAVTNNHPLRSGKVFIRRRDSHSADHPLAGGQPWWQRLPCTGGLSRSVSDGP